MRISDWSSYVCSSDLRSMVMSGGAVAKACRILKGRIQAVATQMLQCAPNEVEVRNDRAFGPNGDVSLRERSEEHTSELQSLMRISYAVFCLKKKNNRSKANTDKQQNKHISIQT